MPQVTRKETERRLRRMAKAEVDMRKGVYDWPGGLSSTRPNGDGRFSRRELLRVGEYSVDTHAGGARLFNDPYYKREVEKEFARREAKLPSILDENPTEILRLGEGMVKEALIRLENDPDSFSTTQLLTFAPQLIKTGYELKVRNDRPGAVTPGATPRMQQFNAFIARSVQIMDSDERESLIDAAQMSRQDRKSFLDQVIDATNVSEEEPDADVIDAEVDSKSS